MLGSLQKWKSSCRSTSCVASYDEALSSGRVWRKKSVAAQKVFQWEAIGDRFVLSTLDIESLPPWSAWHLCSAFRMRRMVRGKSYRSKMYGPQLHAVCTLVAVYGHQCNANMTTAIQLHFVPSRRSQCMLLCICRWHRMLLTHNRFLTCCGKT
jgi:hypothetical protein